MPKINPAWEAAKNEIKESERDMKVIKDVYGRIYRRVELLRISKKAGYWCPLVPAMEQTAAECGMSFQGVRKIYYRLKPKEAKK